MKTSNGSHSERQCTLLEILFYMSATSMSLAAIVNGNELEKWTGIVGFHALGGLVGIGIAFALGGRKVLVLGFIVGAVFSYLVLCAAVVVCYRRS